MTHPEFGRWRRKLWSDRLRGIIPVLDHSNEQNSAGRKSVKRPLVQMLYCDETVSVVGRKTEHQGCGTDK
jgi:hypothetical protein